MGGVALTDNEHSKLLGKIEQKVDNLTGLHEAFDKRNTDGHEVMFGKLDDQELRLHSHNTVVTGMIATATAERTSSDERHSRLWTVLLFTAAAIGAALGTLAAQHLETAL
jgi:hypothetical protein